MGVFSITPLYLTMHVCSPCVGFTSCSPPHSSSHSLPAPCRLQLWQQCRSGHTVFYRCSQIERGGRRPWVRCSFAREERKERIVGRLKGACHPSVASRSTPIPSVHLSLLMSPQVVHTIGPGSSPARARTFSLGIFHFYRCSGGKTFPAH